MSNKTLVILKPDAVVRGLVWEVTKRLETKWLKLVASKMTVLSNAVLTEHYGHLASKPFFPDIVQYMTSAPVVLQIWEGYEVVDVVRLMIWATNARVAQPGTIRGDLASSIGRNVIHASESNEAAQAEITRFFKSEEVFSYKTTDEEIIYEKGER